MERGVPIDKRRRRRRTTSSRARGRGSRSTCRPALTDPDARRRCAAISISTRRCGSAPACRRRGRPPCWCRWSTAPSRRCCSRCAPRAAEPCRADRVSRRQDRPARRDARSPRRCARPRRRSGSTRDLIEPIGYLDLYLTFSGYPHPADGGARRARLRARAQRARGRRRVRGAARLPDGRRQNHAAPQPRLEGRRAALLRHAVRRALHLGRDGGYPAESVRDGFTGADDTGRSACSCTHGIGVMIRPVSPNRAVPRAVRVYAIFLWATRAGVLDPASLAARRARLARHRRARADDRQLRRARAFRRRAAGLDLRAGAYRGRQVRAGADASDADADAALRCRLAARAAAARGCSRCSTATARRRAWSAARCATRCSASRSATSTSPPPRCREEVIRRVDGRRLQGGADRHRARHRHGGGRRPAVRGDDAARGRRDLRPPRQGARSGATGRRDAERRDFTMNALSVARRRHAATIMSAGSPISRRGACASSAMPAKRIAEDYLRILRFFRFHAAYGHGAPDPDGLARLHRRRAPGSSSCRASACAWRLLKLLLAPHAVPTLAVMTEAGLLETGARRRAACSRASPT